MENHVGTPETVLDVGSADGPSVSWMRERGRRIALDLDFAALSRGDVCGTALQMPFRDESFDVVAAFDVLEHCDPEAQALSEIVRVLRPGGRLLIAVPAYEWAWTSFDRDIGHHRRYTRRRLTNALEAAGLEIRRSTYMFAATLPLFTAERLLRKVRRPGDDPDTELPEVSALAERILLGLCRADRRLLRKRNLPFGSSVVAVATKAP
ncbi:MAG TPA: class I SAM-dependent methyltransferase [Marmoricola sp.]|nr:class I SAM-dependent methyltransferase [Marmoricola sp.]